jgi:hypothetical protein
MLTYNTFEIISKITVYMHYFINQAKIVEFNSYYSGYRKAGD